MCPIPYYGTQCENVLEDLELSETISANMSLSVTVTSEIFTEELQNQSSKEFLDFKIKFTDEMNRIYKDIPEYEGVIILSLSPGSVVVEHDVLLKAKHTPEYKNILENVMNEVEKIIRNVTAEQISTNNVCSALLCFNSTNTKVQHDTIKYDPLEECQQKAGKDLAKYFYVEYRNQTPSCINYCTAGYTKSIDCHAGRCILEQSGPQCFCPKTDTYWYSGETCQWATSKSLIYGLLGAGVAVVLMVLLALLMFTFRFKREVKTQKLKVSRLYKWHEEDGGPGPGAFQNTGFDICEAQDDFVQLDSIYSNFQPSLSHIDPETKVQIQRPQVTMTAL